MLQVDIKPYASDALEEAMNLAQVKSLNSFTFSDCLNYLNYAWSDIYNRAACIDKGYYSQTVRISSKLTTLPKYVANTVMIYRAQSPAGYNRVAYRASGPSDMDIPGTYNLQGFELYVPDATRHNIWLQYVPSAPYLFFTRHNRDPKLYDVGDEVYDVSVVSSLYNLYTLQVSEDGEEWGAITAETTYTSTTQIRLLSRVDSTSSIDLTSVFAMENNTIDYISCDYPYIFVSWKNNYTDTYTSGFFDSGVLKAGESGVERDDFYNAYNPYAYTGRDSNVRYLKCSWNDKTGMGVIVRNYGLTTSTYTVEELGFTPDTQLDYPSPVMYRYLVALLADKFSAMNESNVMGVQKELTEARYAFEAFLQKDKSSWQRIRNVNPATWDDYL